MTALAAIAYVRAVVAGVLSRAWRVARGRHCLCEFCRGHRAFTRAGGGAVRRDDTADWIESGPT